MRVKLHSSQSFKHACTGSVEICSLQQAVSDCLLALACSLLLAKASQVAQPLLCHFEYSARLFQPLICRFPASLARTTSHLGFPALKLHACNTWKAPPRRAHNGTSRGFQICSRNRQPRGGRSGSLEAPPLCRSPGRSVVRTFRSSCSHNHGARSGSPQSRDLI